MKGFQNGMKGIYKFLLIALILFNVITFTGGFYVYDENILGKDFYPENSTLKYILMSMLLIVILLFVVHSYYFIFRSVDVDILLSKV